MKISNKLMSLVMISSAVLPVAASAVSAHATVTTTDQKTDNMGGDINLTDAQKKQFSPTTKGAEDSEMPVTHEDAVKAGDPYEFKTILNLPEGTKTEIKDKVLVVTVPAGKKLTDDNIQSINAYVGKHSNWVNKSEIHQHAGIAAASMTSGINGYIKSQGIKPANITTKYDPVFPNFNYAGGYGAVKGVVIHETATPYATIDNSETYMHNHYGSAFVHAFANADRIDLIHNPSYGCWGAGPSANAQFVQIELIREYTKARFAKSVANQAWFAASMLHKYNLKPNWANDGVGTIWSHNDVSLHFHETTHTDPVGYFASWGYSMSEFYELVSDYYYNGVNGSTGNTATHGNVYEWEGWNDYGTVKSGVNIFEKNSKNQLVVKGNTSSLKSKNVQVNGVYGTNNHQLMASIYQNGKWIGYIGWTNFTETTKYKPDFQVSKTETASGNVNMKAHKLLYSLGTSNGKQYVQLRNMTADGYKAGVTVTQKITTKSGTFYRIKQGSDDLGYIRSADVTGTVNLPSKVTSYSWETWNDYGTVKDGATIYRKSGDVLTNHSNTNTLKSKNVQIKGVYATSNKKLIGSIYQNGTWLGYVDMANFTQTTKFKPDFAVTKSENTEGDVTLNAHKLYYGVASSNGKQYVQIQNTSTDAHTGTFVASKRLTTAKAGTFYELTQNGKVVGYVKTADAKGTVTNSGYDPTKDARYVTKQPSDQATDYKVVANNVTIWKIGSNNVLASAMNTNSLSNKEVVVKRQLTTLKDGVYYEVYQNGKALGFVHGDSLTPNTKILNNDRFVSTQPKTIATMWRVMMPNTAIWKIGDNNILTSVGNSNSLTSKNVTIKKTLVSHSFGNYYEVMQNGKVLGYVNHSYLVTTKDAQNDRYVTKLPYATSKTMWKTLKNNAQVWKIGANNILTPAINTNSLASKATTIKRQISTYKNGTYYEIMQNNKVLGYVHTSFFK